LIPILFERILSKAKNATLAAVALKLALLGQMSSCKTARSLMVPILWQQFT
jgi:hypothetical protein